MTGVPESFRRRFVDRCRADLAELEAGPDDETLRGLIHGLAGAAGTFGFPHVSVLAGRVDDSLAEGRGADPGDLNVLLCALRELVTPVD